MIIEEAKVDISVTVNTQNGEKIELTVDKVPTVATLVKWADEIRKDILGKNRYSSETGEIDPNGDLIMQSGTVLEARLVAKIYNQDVKFIEETICGSTLSKIVEYVFGVLNGTEKKT